ncbi:MAG: tetratricopeptide repeat protein, partial [Myxococcaceae bacterium]|nr:tetratricopeptide repeat protein [Myxococcaceae bacterium]
PPPAAPPPSSDFSLDFADLPPPPQPSAPVAPAAAPVPAPAAPVDVSASFGEVDFGEPAPAPAKAAADDLEFDPLSAPKPADDLEADLSAPLPPPKPAAAVDGLEMLSFIDDTAKNEKGAKAGPKKRFHIRRRSGKTFGPFEEGVIVKMLEDGQLLGNEDVSESNDNWVPIGTVPAFQAAIQKLMESPTSDAAPAAAEPEARRTENTAEAMERLKQLYEGRMAAVTIVDRRADELKFKKRLPFLIGGAVLVVLIAAGASLGLTRYGAFGLKLLLPAKVAPGSPQFTQLQKAREALAHDTFKSYTEARDTAQAILRAKEFPEVRAVWCQAVFFLDRRYAAAKPDELNTARRELENIRLLGEKHPEVVKALAGDALSANRPDDARLVLEDAVVRHPKDTELKLLLAEAWVARNQADRAIQTLEQVVQQNADSAKALHMLGRLYQQRAETLRNAGKNDESKKAALKAQELFEKALAADPEHVISAVELAAIQLLVDRDVDAGTAALEKALDEKSRALMGPAEIARARALNGAALAMKFQVKEAVAEFEQAVKLDPGSVFAKAQLGRIYIQQREFAKAVPLFKEASQKEPSNLDYVEGYLTALIGAGKMQDALTVLQTANGQFPDTPKIAYLDARVNDALDNTKKAEDNYLRAIKGDPTLAEANLNLARLYLRLKRLPEARQQLESALEKAPQSADVNAGMGELLLDENKLEEANQAFLKSAELDPTLPDAHLGLSITALRQGRVEDAEKAITQALELDPNLKGGYLQKGLVLFAQNKLDAAIEALEQAKKNEPSNAKINIHIGEVKLAKNDLAGAEAALLAALTQEPRNHEANFFLSRVKSKRAEHTQAIESMRSALDANPDDPVYHYYMGLIYRDAKKVAEAMAEWNEAIRLNPQFADAIEALGQAHLERGEFDQAIEQFRAALAVDPKRARLYGAIGDAYFMAEQWTEAIKSFRQALQADNSLTYVYYKIGRALEQSGKSREAIDWYRKATEVEPDNPSPWYYLAYLQKQRSQRKEAIAAFKSYLERRPDAPDKREIEDEIYDLEHGN